MPMNGHMSALRTPTLSLSHASSEPSWLRQVRQREQAVARREALFVVGCQKSGTTWLAQLLDAHPEICCRGEGHLTDIIFPALRGATKQIAQWQESHTQHRPLGAVTEIALLRAAADQMLGSYLEERTGGAACVRFVGDKTPEAAVGMVPLSTLYPSARFIQIIRDGRDGALSGWAHLERLGRCNTFDSFASYAAYFARDHWVPYVRAAREAGEELGERYTEVRYEDLLTDASGQLRRLFESLGVQADDRVCSHCARSASFERLSGRTRGKEDRTSSLRRGIAGEWRLAMDRDALDAFLAHGEPLLRELGYEVS